MPNRDVNQARYAWIEPGAFEVAPGVHRIPLPMPQDGLRAINVYAIEDEDGLVLIDSGWAVDEARAQLETALGKLGYGLGAVRRFLVTHMHRDHYTLGVTVRRSLGTPVSLGIGEKPSLDAILAGYPDSQLHQLERSGASELAGIVRSAQDADAVPKQDGFELPDVWLEGNDEIRLATRTLRVIHTPGHTHGHAVFLDAESGLLFSGDHVLPHITPSIGLEPVRAELALGDYLDSLHLMLAYPDASMLPAHGPVGGSVHARVRELLDHHDERLALTSRTVRDGAVTAYEAAWKLGWTRHDRAFGDLDMVNQVLAIGETSVHLDLLVARGELRSSIVDGVVEYRTEE